MSVSKIYKDRDIFDINTFLEILRLFISNLILAIIFLFLIIEELEWALFSSTKVIVKDRVYDKTSWNFKKVFKV